jgi:hypothetical protein
MLRHYYRLGQGSVSRKKRNPPLDYAQGAQVS